MNPKIEGVHSAEFLLSEGNGQYSREVVTISSGAGVVKAGTLLNSSNAPVNGDSVLYSAAAKVVLGAVDATDADADAAAIVRAAEVHGDLLAWPTGATVENKTAAATALAAQGIIVRWTYPGIESPDEQPGGEEGSGA